MRVLTRSPLFILAVIVVGLATIGPKIGAAYRNEHRRAVLLYVASPHPFNVTYLAEDGLKGPFHVTKGSWGPRRVYARIGVTVYLAITPVYEGPSRPAVPLVCRITSAGRSDAVGAPTSYREASQNTALGCEQPF